METETETRKHASEERGEEKGVQAVEHNDTDDERGRWTWTWMNSI